MINSLPFIPTPIQYELLGALVPHPAAVRQPFATALAVVEESNLWQSRVALDGKTTASCIAELQSHFFRRDPDFVFNWLRRAIGHRLPPAAVFHLPDCMERYRQAGTGIRVYGAQTQAGRATSEYLQLLERGRDLSPDAAADRAAISIAEYLRYRRGKRGLAPAHIAGIAHAFGLDPAALAAAVREWGHVTSRPYEPSLPALHSKAKPASRVLAELLREAARRHFGGSTRRLSEAAGVSSGDLRRLLRGRELPSPGIASPRFKETVALYQRLSETLGRKEGRLARRFEGAVREAYLEKQGWLEYRSWFENRTDWLSFFKEGKRQILLERAGLAFRRPESFVPEERLTVRLIDWWMGYNFGIFHLSFSEPGGMERLLGVTLPVFRSLYEGRFLTEDPDVVRGLAAKIDNVPPAEADSRSPFFADWVAWRKSAALRVWDKAGLGDNPARAIYARVLDRWIPFNGGKANGELEREGVARLGVWRGVLLRLRYGLLPDREPVIRHLAAKVEGLSEEEVDQKSEIMRHWRMWKGAHG